MKKGIIIALFALLGGILGYWLGTIGSHWPVNSPLLTTGFGVYTFILIGWFINTFLKKS